MATATAIRDRGGKLVVDDLGLEDAFTDRPLDEDTLRCLQYMHDVESRRASPRSGRVPVPTFHMTVED